MNFFSRITPFKLVAFLVVGLLFSNYWNILLSESVHSPTNKLNIFSNCSFKEVEKVTYEEGQAVLNSTIEQSDFNYTAWKGRCFDLEQHDLTQDSLQLIELKFSAEGLLLKRQYNYLHLCLIKLFTEFRLGLGLGNVTRNFLIIFDLTSVSESNIRTARSELAKIVSYTEEVKKDSKSLRPIFWAEALDPDFRAGYQYENVTQNISLVTIRAKSNSPSQGYYQQLKQLDESLKSLQSQTIDRNNQLSNQIKNVSHQNKLLEDNNSKLISNNSQLMASNSQLRTYSSQLIKNNQEIQNQLQRAKQKYESDTKKTKKKLEDRDSTIKIKQQQNHKQKQKIKALDWQLQQLKLLLEERDSMPKWQAKFGYVIIAILTILVSIGIILQFKYKYQILEHIKENSRLNQEQNNQLKAKLNDFKGQITSLKVQQKSTQNQFKEIKEALSKEIESQKKDLLQQMASMQKAIFQKIKTEVTDSNKKIEEALIKQIESQKKDLLQQMGSMQKTIVQKIKTEVTDQNKKIEEALSKEIESQKKDFLQQMDSMLKAIFQKIKTEVTDSKKQPGTIKGKGEEAKDSERKSQK